MLTAEMEQRRLKFNQIEENQTIIWREKEVIVLQKHNKFIRYAVLEDHEENGAHAEWFRLYQEQIDGSEPVFRLPLRCETNTRAMRDEVYTAAMQDLNVSDIQVDFEHGQWFVTQLSTGAQWSVHDAESNGNEYFEFDQISEGDDD